MLLGLAGPQQRKTPIRAGRRRHRTHYRVPEPGSHHRTRVSENGTVTFPLIGSVELGGQTIAKAEQTVASKLREGGFALKPQVNILPLCRSAATRSRCSARSTAPAATRSGNLPTPASPTCSPPAASPLGADTVVLIGVRDGKSVRREIDLPTLFAAGSDADDKSTLRRRRDLRPSRPVFYIYGECSAGRVPPGAQHERDAGPATGGGTSARGTVKGLQVHRRDADGKLQVIEPKMDDLLKPDDVIYIKESLF